MYDNQAFEYADKIESGEMDPEDVDVRELVYDDETHLTPQLEELLTPEQREEFARLQREKIDERAAERERELSANQRKALDTLKSAVDTDEELRETIQLGDSRIVVTKRITGKLESHINKINKEAQSDYPDLDDVKDSLITAITALIVDDDEPGDEPHSLTDREVWEEFYWERGSEALFDVFQIVSDPALERWERLEKFREGGRRR